MHRFMLRLQTTAALLGLALLAACGPPQAPASESAAAPAPPPNIVTPEIQAAIAAMPAPYNEANYVEGRKAFAQCRACHQIKAEAGNSVGPNLHGVFGRKAGTVPGFNYSAAVRNAGFSWDEDKIDHWLANPQTFLPKNNMAFAGYKDPIKRRDLIAYLKIETAK